MPQTNEMKVCCRLSVRLCQLWAMDRKGHYVYSVPLFVCGHSLVTLTLTSEHKNGSQSLPFSVNARASTFCFTSTEARWLIRDGDGGGGEGPDDTVRLNRGYRPKKTGETVDRRQNNGSVKAVSPRHCPATSAPRNCCFNCRA